MKWEYLTDRVPLEYLTAEYLNGYGADGWQLVNVYVWTQEPAEADLIFKREVAND